MRLIQGILLLLFLGALLTFTFQNGREIDVRFLNWRLSSSLSLVLVSVYTLGMLTGWTVVAFFRRSVRTISSTPRD